jgi:hypothetical protein
MERWARSEPHRIWWQNFLRDSGGTGFWHETYFMRGGIEAIYDDVTGRPAVSRPLHRLWRLRDRCSPRASESGCPTSRRHSRPAWQSVISTRLARLSADAGET